MVGGKHECAEGLLNQTNYLSTSLHGPLFIGPICRTGNVCVCVQARKSGFLGLSFPQEPMISNHWCAIHTQTQKYIRFSTVLKPKYRANRVFQLFFSEFYKSVEILF